MEMAGGIGFRIITHLSTCCMKSVNVQLLIKGLLFIFNFEKGVIIKKFSYPWKTIFKFTSTEMVNNTYAGFCSKCQVYFRFYEF